MATKKVSVTVQDSTADLAEQHLANNPGMTMSSLVDRALREKLSRDGARTVADWSRNTPEGRELSDTMRAARARRGQAQQAAA